MVCGCTRISGQPPHRRSGPTGSLSPQRKVRQMNTRIDALRLTVDKAALQRLPEVSPTADGVAMLGANAMRCGIFATCDCTRVTDRF